MKLKRTLICLFMIVLIIFSLQTTSKAAGFSIKAANNTIDIGKTTSLTINASGYLGKFQITSSDSSIVSVSESTKWIEDTSVSITLTAHKAGKATITVTAADGSDTSGNVDITGSKQTTTITVPEPPAPSNPPSNNNGDTTSKSSDNSLKSLTVGSRNYSKPKNDITVPSVNFKTTSIELKAETNDSRAKVSGTGTKELTTGTNKFTITVTAENGAKANYVVRITRLAEENGEPNIVDNTPTPITPSNVEEENPEETEPEQELRLTSLEIPEVELTPLFNSEVFEYTIYLVDEEELNITAVPNLEGTFVEIIGNTGLVEGENIITIKLTKDQKQVEYKITANKWSEQEIEEEVKQDMQNNDNKKGFIGIINDWWNKSGPMSVVFTVVLALLGTSIIFAIISYKYSNNVKKVTKHSREDFVTNEDLFGGRNRFKD